jgi:hypothetical protein
MTSKKNPTRLHQSLPKYLTLVMTRRRKPLRMKPPSKRSLNITSIRKKSKNWLIYFNKPVYLAYEQERRDESNRSRNQGKRTRSDEHVAEVENET